MMKSLIFDAKSARALVSLLKKLLIRGILLLTPFVVVLTSCRPERTECVSLTGTKLKLCMPERYFASPILNAKDPNANIDEPYGMRFRIPAAELPIVPNENAYSYASVGLTVLGDSLPQKRDRAIVLYKATYREKSAENGMIVLTEPNFQAGYWAEDILIPANGEPAYLVCADKRNLPRTGLLCEVQTDWGDDSFQKHIILSFFIPRTDAANWKTDEEKVKEFLKKYIRN